MKTRRKPADVVERCPAGFVSTEVLGLPDNEGWHFRLWRDGQVIGESRTVGGYYRFEPAWEDGMDLAGHLNDLPAGS